MGGRTAARARRRSFPGIDSTHVLCRLYIRDKQSLSEAAERHLLQGAVDGTGCKERSLGPVPRISPGLHLWPIGQPPSPTPRAGRNKEEGVSRTIPCALNHPRAAQQANDVLMRLRSRN